MAAGIKTAANAASNIVKNKTTLKSLATTAKNMGQNVLDGVAGNYKNYTRRLGANILKSNMTEADLKTIAKHGMESTLKDQGNKTFIKDTIQDALNGSKKGIVNGKKVNEYVGNAMKKHAWNMGPNNKAWGYSPTDLLLGKAMAKTDIGYRVGDAIGGGIRDTYRSLKAGQGVSNALKAGFTHKVGGEWQNVNGVRKMVGGVSKVRMDRVAGAAFAVGAAGRVVSGGGLYRDRYGRVNAPGIPFI